MRKVAIHQPSYMPWFGILDKIARCDCFIVLDSVQYNKRSFQHRTLFSSASGAQYLSLAVNSKGHQQGLCIKDVVLADRSLPKKHFETLRHRYRKSPGWSVVRQQLEPVLSDPPLDLLSINLATLKIELEFFKLRPQLVLASELETGGAKSELMLNLTKAVGGDVYLSGSGARDYMRHELFDSAGVGVEYQEFAHPIYPQSHGGEFQPGCFALEWVIEDPIGVCQQFHEHLWLTGRQQPRCAFAEQGG